MAWCATVRWWTGHGGKGHEWRCGKSGKILGGWITNFTQTYTHAHVLGHVATGVIIGVELSPAWRARYCRCFVRAPLKV